MSQICLNIPALKESQTVDLEVVVNGQRRVMNYRVESVPWPNDLTPAERIDVLRDYIKEYAEGWDLVQIGPPDNGLVPIMFKQRDMTGQPAFHHTAEPVRG